jgi:valyl-tRNA synthetase
LHLVSRFFWNDFCDWYLEWTKPRMREQDERATAQNILAFVLDQTLRLLHPFVPFITEGIFQKLNEIAPARELKGMVQAKEANALIVAEWPEKLESLGTKDIEKQIATVQNVIRPIRDIRNKHNIAPSRKLTVSVDGSQAIGDVLSANSDLICHLAGVESFSVGPNIEKPKNAATAIVEDIQVYVHDVIDPEAERARLQKQKQQIQNAIGPVYVKLNNEDFINKAKPQVVQQARAKLKELTAQAEAVDRHLSELKG